MAMTISLSDAGKRFNREWIFRHLTYTFEEEQSYAITGPNGSGKSTLLQVLSGALHMNEGRVKYDVRDKNYKRKSFEDDKTKYQISNIKYGVPAEKIYRHISICTPYLEVVEEMTLNEFLDFHHGFKPFLAGLTKATIISIIGLENAANKQIRYYSSGMKQRVKLAQAIFSDTPAVFLDEPCTNLDIAGIDLYNQLITEYCKERLLIVSSNDEIEYRFCKERINVSDYKN
jgi:ABC-type multidrug transport system ATPase subunit